MMKKGTGINKLCSPHPPKFNCTNSILTFLVTAFIFLLTGRSNSSKHPNSWKRPSVQIILKITAQKSSWNRPRQFKHLFLGVASTRNYTNRTILFLNSRSLNLVSSAFEGQRCKELAVTIAGNIGSMIVAQKGNCTQGSSQNCWQSCISFWSRHFRKKHSFLKMYFIFLKSLTITVENKTWKNRWMTCPDLLALLDSHDTNWPEARILTCTHLIWSRNRLYVSKCMKTSSLPFHLACCFWLSTAFKKRQNEKQIGT